VTTVWFRPVNGLLEPLPVAALKPLDEVERIMIAELEARAPRPRLKPDGMVEPATVLPAEYQSQGQSPPVPERRPEGTLLAAGMPLPEPKPTPAS
jgi:hypothetical protein